MDHKHGWTLGHAAEHARFQRIPTSFAREAWQTEPELESSQVSRGAGEEVEGGGKNNHHHKQNKTKKQPKQKTTLKLKQTWLCTFA